MVASDHDHILKLFLFGTEVAGDISARFATTTAGVASTSVVVVCIGCSTTAATG